jgi:hypothetical protein
MSNPWKPTMELQWVSRPMFERKATTEKMGKIIDEIFPNPQVSTLQQKHWRYINPIPNLAHQPDDIEKEFKWLDVPHEEETK